MFSQVWFCLGWLKLMFFVPALCDIETIFCDHLTWNKVQAYCWMCHHGCWQSVINVAVHAAVTKAQKFNIRHSLRLWCVIRCFYLMQNDWLRARASISTGAVMIVVDKPWNKVWWDSNDQTVCNHCQDTNSLQHLCPDTCRKMNVLKHRYSNSAAVWSEGCSPTTELTDGPRHWVNIKSDSPDRQRVYFNHTPLGSSFGFFHYIFLIFTIIINDSNLLL